MFYPRSLVLGPPSSVGYGFHYVGIGLSSNQVLVGYFHSLCASADLAYLAGSILSFLPSEGCEAWGNLELFLLSA